MRYLTAFAVLLLFSSHCNSETLTKRRISSEDIGTLVFMAPENWSGVESYDELEAATVYELTSRKEKFRLRISVKNAGFETEADQGPTDAQVIARLDGYLEYVIAEYGNLSVEGGLKAARFSQNNHGIYARMPVRNPGKGQYEYYTHGARVVDRNFIVFSLSSNDKDLSVLKTTVDLVASFRTVNEWANAPDSFVCNVDQLAGFGIVDKEWGAITSKKVKHSFIVRRAQPGDAFENTSEWVFSATESKTADTSCDNEQIAHGLFLCKGKDDEVFRMDSKTLRFIYAYLGGYHDVAPGIVPDEESPKPQIEIGSCTAR